MDSENFNFSNSCKTLISQKSEIFVSAFPGKIIFGNVDQVGYKKLNYFKFNHFELFHFFVALTNIFKFLSDTSDTKLNTANKGIILTLNTFEVYYWIVKDVFINNNIQKQIVFGIEKEAKVVFELNLTLKELNELINIIAQTILSCLCLKSIEKQLLENVALQSTEDIIALKNHQMCENFIKNFEEINKFSIDSVQISNLIDLVIYYNELLIVIQKLKSMYNPEVDNRIEAILDL